MKELKLKNLNIYTMLVDVIFNVWIIILALIAGYLSTSVYLSSISEPTYKSIMTVSVNSTSTYTNVSTDLAKTIEIAEILQNVFSSDILKNKVSSDIGKDFSGEIKATKIAETNLIQITVTESSPTKAHDALVSVYKNYADVFDNNVFDDSRLNILSYPSVPVAASNSLSIPSFSAKIAILAAFIVGVIICAFSFVRNTVKQPSDIEDYVDAPLFGIVYHESKYQKTHFKSLKKNLKIARKNNNNELAFELKDKMMKGAPLLLSSNVSYSFSESFKKMAIKLEYMQNSREINSVLVTSVDEHEGKSTISANLAIQLSLDGKKVLLIDGDLRKPSIGKFFPDLVSDEKDDLYEYLVGKCDLKSILKKDKNSGLDIILGKNGHKDTLEAISNGKLEQLISGMSQIYDFVVIDTAPMMLVSDTESIAEFVDVSLLMLSQDRMPIEDVNDTIDILNKSKTILAGCILNDMKTVSSVLGVDLPGTSFMQNPNSSSEYSYKGKSKNSEI